MSKYFDLFNSNADAKKAVLIGTSTIILYKVIRILIESFTGMNEMDHYYLYQYILTPLRLLGALIGGFFAFKLYRDKKHLLDFKNTKGLIICSISLCFMFLMEVFYLTPTFNISHITKEIFINFIVGFFEEFCFRALLFAGLVKLVKLPAALIISSLVFSFWHFGVNLAYVHLFISGCFFAMLFYYGMNLFYLSLYHSIWDMIGFGILNNDSYSSLKSFNFIIGLFELILTVIIIALIIKRNERKYSLN